MQLVLGLDIGSSSLRANLFAGDGRALEGCETQLAYPVHTTSDGGVEVPPGELLARLTEAIDRTIERAGSRAGAIQGVGICTLASSLIGVDRAGQPTTPIYTWADTRPAAEAAKLRAKVDEEEVRERTGCYIHGSYLPARLLWLRRTRPEAYSRTAKWLALGDWVQLELSGRAAQSLSIASWGGLLNRHTLDWDPMLLEAAGLDSGALPPLVDVDSGIGGLRAEYARRWPPLSKVVWFPAVADGAAGNVGSGCHTSRDIAVQVGTTAAVRALVQGRVERIPEGLWCYRLDRQAAVLGGALSEGGSLFDWLRSVTGEEGWAEVAKEAAGMPPDSHGLTVLPFVAGERSLGWDGSARAAIAGLSLGTGRAQMLRAAQEAVAYRIGMVYERLVSEIPEVSRVVGSGGALLGIEGWAQIVTDVLGRPLTLSGEEEASARGAALLALRSLGLIASFSGIPAGFGERLTPNMEHHAIYRRAMRRQAGLYSAIKGWAESTRGP